MAVAAAEAVAEAVAVAVAVAVATCDRRPVALNAPAARAGAVGAAHRHHGPSGLQRLLGDAHLLRQPDALSTGGRLRPEVNGAVIAAVRQEEQALGGAGRLLPHHLGAQNLLARAMQRGGRAQRKEHARQQSALEERFCVEASRSYLECGVCIPHWTLHQHRTTQDNHCGTSG